MNPQLGREKERKKAAAVSKVHRKCTRRRLLLLSSFLCLPSISGFTICHRRHQLILLTSAPEKEKSLYAPRGMGIEEVRPYFRCIPLFFVDGYNGRRDSSFLTFP